MAIDTKKLPDWRTHPAYVQQAAKLDALRAILPDLDAKEAKAMLAVSEAQDALDDTETLALANRAKPRDVELKKTALEAAQARLAEATTKREQAVRQIRLLEGGVALLCDDARAEAAAVLRDAAYAAIERLERALEAVVDANEDALALHGFIQQQFPGSPVDASYPDALGMLYSPWYDLRRLLTRPGVAIETRYTIWCRALGEWKVSHQMTMTTAKSA